MSGPPPAPCPMVPPPAAPGAGLGRLLNVGAFLLALVALLASLLIPGPAGLTGAAGPLGPTGSTGSQGPAGQNGMNGLNCWDLNGNGVPDLPAEDLNGDSVVNVSDCTGPRGPAGSGALVASGVATPWRTGGLQIVGCTNVLAFTLAVPAAGTLVLSSTVHVWVEHLSGATDTWAIFHGDTATMCSDTATDRCAFFQEISSSIAADSFMNEAGTLVNAFPVPGAGTYTYYVNVEMYAGQSTGDRVSEASAVMVFYPS